MTEVAPSKNTEGTFCQPYSVLPRKELLESMVGVGSKLVILIFFLTYLKTTVLEV